MTALASGQASAASGGFSPEDAAKAAALGVVVKKEAPLFSPGQPLPAANGIAPQGRPRTWGFPANINVTPQPRSTEITTFGQLRNLARLYEGVQLCEKVYFDILRQLTPTIVPVTPGDQGDAGEQSAILAMLEKPDGRLDLADWSVMALRDTLEIDALAVYVRRNRRGEWQGLDLIDGATIKPLQDARGQVPQAPLPGYQQILYGLPAGLYTDQDILYRRENPRTDSPYGFSRVEMLIMRVNQALRKETFDLARFTDGNVPPGILVPPVETQWTPEEVQAFEDEFNALLAGNDQRRNRIKVAAPGMVYTQTAPPDLLTPFDEFLLNVTVGAFGLTMAELGFTQDVNKSSGESLENVLYRRAVRPSANFLAALFTTVIRRFYGPRYKFAWQAQEEEDKNSVADRYAKLIPLGAASVDDYAAETGIPKPGIGPYILTKSGPVWLDGEPAGYVPPTMPDDGGDDDDEDGDGDAAKRADLRRYERVALKAVKAGRPVRTFASAAIPAPELATLRDALAACRTADEVRAVFAPRKEAA